LTSLNRGLWAALFFEVKGSFRNSANAFSAQRRQGRKPNATILTASTEKSKKKDVSPKSPVSGFVALATREFRRGF
jgi:hypothetical protein